MNDRLRTLALKDGRFSPEAYRFLLDGLEHAIRLAGRSQKEGPERHVTGSEVLAGLIEYARSSFGPLAAQVWRSWGLTETLDWGRIVFVLVDNELLARQDDDRMEDFQTDWEFEPLFVEEYEVRLPSQL